jgi:hypothetical protein
MDGACSTSGDERIAYSLLVLKPEEKKTTRMIRT